jgi:hypothetical protein
MYITKRREWKKMYELFKYHSAPGDTAYLISLTPPGKERSLFIAHRVYYGNKAERYVRLKGGRFSIVNDYQNIRSGKQRGNIYFVVPRGSFKLKQSYFTHLSGIIIYHFKGLSIAHLLNDGRLPKKILNFFHCLADNLGKKIGNYLVYEMLFELEMANRNLGKAKRYLDTLVKIDTHGQLKARIERFKRRWQSIKWEGKKSKKREK